MEKDLVCGMDVDKEQAQSQGLTSEHDGQTYYFCAPSCKQQFDQDPERYTRQSTGQS